MRLSEKTPNGSTWLESYTETMFEVQSSIV